MTTIKCPVCNTTGHLNDFDQHPNGTGCWCPCCQSFIWHDPIANTQHNTLILEQKAPSVSLDEAHFTAQIKFNKRLSPLRYPGGKSKLIDYLFTRLQLNKLDTFVEVFAGGASFGLALLDAGVINHLVLNDADKNLITFWQEALHNPAPLLNKINTITPTHKDYEKAKELLATNATVSPTELAWAYLLTNRLSYSGIQKAGCLGGKGGPTEALLARYNPKTLTKQITHLATLKDRITLLNQNYAEVIETYYWDSPEHPVTLFCDPPYHLKGKALYDHYFTDQDHRALAELVQSLTLEFPGCADILITYDNTPFIKELYWFMQQTTITRKYSV